MFDKFKKKKDPLDSDNDLMLSNESVELEIKNPNAIANAAREIAKRITRGEEENQHLGNYSVEMLVQEIFSLGNVKPAFRDAKWHRKAEQLQRVAEGIKDPRIKARVKRQYQDYISRYSN